MKTLIVIICFMHFGALHCFGQQTSYPSPKGYWPFLSIENKPFEVSADFDNDGIDDLVKVFTKSKDSDQTNIVVVFLSSIYYNSKVYSYFPFETYNYSLVYDKKSNVLSIASCIGTGRFCKNFKFKYYPNLGDMRLIGYDQEYFGNYEQAGAYKKTVNLLSNKYDISKPKSKNKIVNSTSIPLITLKAFDENNIMYLENIGSNHYSNE